MIQHVRTSITANPNSACMCTRTSTLSDSESTSVHSGALFSSSGSITARGHQDGIIQSRNVIQLACLQYQKHQHAAPDLGDADSQFTDVGSISVHHKRCYPSASSRPRRRPSFFKDSRASSPHIALYHGFGANLWMWRAVQQQMADDLGTQVPFSSTASPSRVTVHHTHHCFCDPTLQKVTCNKVCGENVAGGCSAGCFT